MSRATPLRRSYGLELALGLASIAIGLGVWWLAPTPREAPSVVADVSAATEPSVPEASLLAPEASAPSSGESRETIAPVPRAAAPAPAGGARRALDGMRPDGADAVPCVDVLVIDAFGRPAPGVPVADAPAVGPARGAARTGLDGKACIAAFAWSAGETSVIAVVLPLREPPRVELAPERTLQPVTLVLPPTGGLRVRVTDVRGEALASGATVELRARGPEAARIQASAAVVDGLAEFPWLDLGLELELTARHDDRGGRPGSLVLAGPSVPDETREATLVLGERWPRLSLRVLDAGGGVLRNTPLRVRITHEPLTPQVTRGTTDEDGWLVLEVVGQPHTAIPRSLELVAEAPLRIARVELGRTLRTDAPVELGDVRLQARDPRLLAAGVVRDAYGPVEGAEVRLSTRRNPFTRQRTTQTDAAGRFELSGEPIDDGLVLEVRSEAHLPADAVEIEAGAHALAFTLVRAASLALELLAPEGVNSFDLDVTAVDEAGKERQLFQREIHGARMEARVPAGSHEVVVRSASGPLLARYPRVRVDLEGTHDPRLQPLDLRQHARLAEFLLRGNGGEPLEDRDVAVEAPDGTELSVATRQDGSLRLVLPAAWTVVELVPEGHVGQAVALADFVRTLTFAPR